MEDEYHVEDYIGPDGESHSALSEAELELARVDAEMFDTEVDGLDSLERWIWEH